MTETAASRTSGMLDNDILLGTPKDNGLDTVTDNDDIVTTLGGNKLQTLQIEVLASGLDSPRTLSFGPDGALYVTEAGHGGNGASTPSPSQSVAVLSYGATGAITHIQDGNGIGTGSDAGALIYLSPDGKTRTTITDELVSPTDLTMGADGDLYISNKGFIAGQGEVLRLNLDTISQPCG